MRSIGTNVRPGILLVDDVEANLVALEAQFAHVDCDLVRASSGNEALKQLLKRDFAVMLLDVQMPDMDGFEVAKYARDNPSTRDVPIIFLTAMFGNEEGMLRGYGTGAVDFLLKPVNPYVLRSKVQVFLELYVNRRRLADEVLAHEKTLADLDAFNYSVSHDLRAPLRPLLGYSEILLEEHGDKLDDKGKDYLDRIHKGAERMSQLIEDLLSLSRLSRAEVSPTALDLAALAESIVVELRTHDPKRDIEFVRAPRAEVRGDPRLLRIVLENLLRNAWKFTQKTAAPRIEVGTQNEKGLTAFFVRDNGAGFDPNYASKLFAPFQRLHSNAEFEGTGIGLAIVARIIGHHGGQVWAESTPNDGATFFFTVST